MVQDFETPPKKEFSRSLESFIKNCVDYLHKCRPLAVSVRNAYKHIKHIITQLSTVQVESDVSIFKERKSVKKVTASEVVVNLEEVCDNIVSICSVSLPRSNVWNFYYFIYSCRIVNLSEF